MLSVCFNYITAWIIWQLGVIYNLSHFYTDRANASSLGVANRNQGRLIGFVTSAWHYQYIELFAYWLAIKKKKGVTQNMQIAVCSQLFSQSPDAFILHTHKHTLVLTRQTFCCENTAGNGPHASWSQSPQPPNPFDRALFLNTQNALWGCTLSAMFTGKKKENGEGERRREDAPGGFM